MRFLVAITGASGIIYGVKLVEVLRAKKQDVSVIISSGAKKVAKAELEQECDAKKITIAEKQKLPNSDLEENDISAPFASGSYVCKNLDAMVICPCSLKTLGEIANGVGSNLIARAAEVCLKERRKLVLVVRETPLSYIAIKNMETVTLAGAVVLPACPGFYGKPKTIGDLVDFVVGKVLDQIGVENKLFKRWKE